MKPAVVAILMKLGAILEYANSRNDLADQRGFYGDIYNAIQKLLVVECGKEIGEYAMEHLNFGGDSSWGKDILNAVEDAKAYIREQEEWKKEQEFWIVAADRTQVLSGPYETELLAETEREYDRRPSVILAYDEVCKVEADRCELLHCPKHGLPPEK